MRCSMCSMTHVLSGAQMRATLERVASLPARAFWLVVDLSRLPSVGTPKFCTRIKNKLIHTALVLR